MVGVSAASGIPGVASATGNEVGGASADGAVTGAASALGAFGLRSRFVVPPAVLPWRADGGVSVGPIAGATGAVDGGVGIFSSRPAAAMVTRLDLAALAVLAPVARAGVATV
ncbi:hypothetical protein Y958_29365 [Nitrospirillum viridazoti CBAmc]|uniref:Uncharacterized protein n=1 Tax=Nitrospirillum viridazoti CBAmc TaxID=1441467 RepID=A0A248K3R1_9PROT|nr:hypothetical protein Y958_29365 [Nitrospirillum amazonense CBAmc]